jgi:hypothetical protein
VNGSNLADDENKRILKSATETKGGFRDLPVGIVLAARLGLVIILFVVVYLSFFGKG